MEPVGARMKAEALAAARFDALYVRDAQGRLLHANEHTRRPAPRVHVYLTPSLALLGVRADVSDALASRLDHAIRALTPPDEDAGDLADQVCAMLGGALSSSGPSYLLPPVDEAGAGTVFAIDEVGAEVLRASMADWLPDVGKMHPFWVALEGASAVAVCASARMGSVVHEAGVETVSAARRQGHGRRVVAAWAAAVRATGRTPCYSTDADNEGSIALAQSLGAQRIGTDLRFEAAP